MGSYKTEDLKAWRSWSREAPMELLKEFISHVDAGETELRTLSELAEGGGRFIVEIHPLEEEKDAGYHAEKRGGGDS